MPWIDGPNGPTFRLDGDITVRHRQPAEPTLCDCSDPGCPVHLSAIVCMAEADLRVWRIDMQDESGTGMCTECAQDALASGLFTTEPPWDPWNEADWHHEREREER